VTLTHGIEEEEGCFVCAGGGNVARLMGVGSGPGSWNDNEDCRGNVMIYDAMMYGYTA